MRSVLPRPGHAFEQHAAAAEQRDEGVLDDLGVADDDFADFILQRGVGVAEGLDLGFGAHGIIWKSGTQEWKLSQRNL